jgi:hypothetical protein
VSDWPSKVTETPGQLAYYISSAYSSHLKSIPNDTSSRSSLFSKLGFGKEDKGAASVPRPSGVYDPSESQKLTVLNGSSVSPDGGKESLLVFPDYKVCIVSILCMAHILISLR